MADLAELHQELGCVFGLTLAIIQLAHRAAGLVGQENDSELVQVLQRLGESGSQVQRQCQSLIARHPGIRTGRITAASRKVKTGIIGGCGEDTALRDVLGFLVRTVDQARGSAASLAACEAAGNDQAVADFADFTISILDDQAAAVSAVSSRLGRPSRIVSPWLGTSDSPVSAS